MKTIVKKIVLIVLSLLLIFGIRWAFYEVRFALYEKEFKEDYGVHIAKDQSKQKIQIDYKLKNVTNTKKLCDKLGDIKKCFDELPEGLIEEIKEPIYVETKDGIEQVVPSGEIQLIFSDTIDRKTKADGITEYGIGWDMIALSVNSNQRIEKLFYHEFSHLLDKRNSWNSFTTNAYYKEWNAVNPEGFKYYSQNYDYVMSKCQSKELVAFISEYAATNQNEDRAELFAYLMILKEREDFEQLMTYPRIAEKIKYLNASLIEQYDCFDDNNCFQWQTWLGEN